MSELSESTKALCVFVPFCIEAVLLFGVSAFRLRSIFTAMEIFALIIWRWYDPSITFLGFFTAKLLVSLLFYYVYFFSRKSRMVRLTYHLAHPDVPSHAGISYGDDFYHYAFPRVRAKDEDLDRSWKLEARKGLKRREGFKYPVNVDCGFGFPGVPDEDIKKTLELCGRCHNWALITLCELSADKFLSMSMLSFLRWDVWILLALATLLLPMSILSGFDSGGFGVEGVFLGLTIYDILNMSRDRLAYNRRRAQEELHATWRSVLKLIAIAIVWPAYVFYIKIYNIVPTVQFFILISLSCTVTFLLNRSDWKFFSLMVFFSVVTYLLYSCTQYLWFV